MTPSECVLGVLILWLALGGVMVSITCAVYLAQMWRARTLRRLRDRIEDGD